MNRFDLVIFDCDGVLVDSERIVVRVDAQICQERGWGLTEEDVIREFVGLSDDAMRARLCELTGEALAPGWARGSPLRSVTLEHSPPGRPRWAHVGAAQR